MARLIVGDREYRAINLKTARARDVAALQTESGLRLKVIAEQGKTNDVFAMAVASFLSQRMAGVFVKWDDLMDGDLDALGQIELDPADEARIAEAQADADPPEGATPEGATSGA